MPWCACGSGAMLLQDTSTLSPCAAPLGATVATCGRHTMMIADGSVLASGSNELGQLGLGLGLDDDTIEAPPRGLSLPLPVRRIACGWSHTAILLADGSLLTCGANSHGQLGLGLAAGASVRTPTRVPLLPPLADVAAGGSHTLALCAGGGGAWAWGRNRHGALGVGGGAEAQRSAARVEGLAALLPPGTTLSAVAAGWAFSAALTSDGRVVTWGDNRHGQCGRPPRGRGGEGVGGGGGEAGGGGGGESDGGGGGENGGLRSRESGGERGVLRSGPRAAESAWERGEKCGGDGRPAPAPALNLTPTPTPTPAPPRATATPRDDVLPPGAAALLPGVVATGSLACGWSHVAVLATREAPQPQGQEQPEAQAQGQLLTWGRADLGQLGRAPLTSERHDWRPLCSSGSDAPGGDAHEGGTFRAVAAACGAEHTLSLGACGCVLACGWNEHGNLGMGDVENRLGWTRIPMLGCGGEGPRATAVAAGGAVTFVQS